MKISCCLLLYWIFYYGANAQSTDTLQAHADLTMGHQFHGEYQNFDSAYFYFYRAASSFQEAGQTERYAYAILRSAFSAHRGNKYQLAESQYKKSLEVYESIYPVDNLKIAAPCMGLGSLYAVIGNYYQALIYTTRAHDLRRKHLGEDHIETGVSYYNTGIAYMNYGEYENAMDAYLKALPIYLKHHGEEHRRLSSLYINMGILYDKRGEPEKALEYYNRSTAIDQKIYGENYYLLAYNYYNMAISYLNLGNLTLAEQYYRKTIELSEVNQLHELHAIGHYGLGKVAAERGYNTEAMELYEAAIDLFLEYFDHDFPGINHTYRGMAQVLADEGAYPEAHQYLERTLELLKSNFGSYHPFIASTYRQQASLYKQQDQYKEALNAIEYGYNALKKESFIEGANNTPDAYSDKHILLDLTREEAEVYESRYRHTGDLDDLKLALGTLEQAIDFLDQIRRGYLLDDSKLLLQEEAVSTYEQAISTAYQLFQETDDAHYLKHMFRFMEKSKATLLSETLQSNTLKKIQGIPDSILVTEMSTRRKIDFAESQLGSTEVDQDSLMDQIFSLKRSYDTLAEKIAQNYPRYYELKYGIQVKDISAVQNLLQDRQAAITYFLGSENWYILAVSGETVAAHKIDSTVFNDLLLGDFRVMVSDPEVEWNDQVAFTLYRELLAKPLEKLNSPVDRIIITPDGALGHIPFGAMLTSMSPTPQGKKSFVVNQYAISYSPSFTILDFSGGDRYSSRDYHGFAPVDYFEGLVSLPGSLTEINTSSALFNGKSYLRQEALESKLKGIQSCGIVHLAMHTLVDDEDPMKSRLIFSHDRDSTEDGNLYANEIYNLKLKSNLTILSSCNTGFGKIKRGEGIMNLSRAFQFAGSPNIIMSLWQASDVSTTDIVYAFLKNLKKGLPLDRSLQQAKLSYLENADPYKAHPAFWATFVFMGDSSPIHMKNYTWIWIISGFLILTILIVIMRNATANKDHHRV